METAGVEAEQGQWPDPRSQGRTSNSRGRAREGGGSPATKPGEAERERANRRWVRARLIWRRPAGGESGGGRAEYGLPTTDPGEAERETASQRQIRARPSWRWPTAREAGQGCDGSILLDGADGEKFALPNKNSVRGYEVIDAIKADLENMCPGVVSCADIVALAAGYGLLFSGGPWYNVLLGRRDGLKANQSGADNGLPSPFEPISSIVKKFADVGLDTKDVVVLSGAHTIGRARCVLFSNRLASTTSSADPTLDATMAANLQKLCTGGDGNQTTALDVSSADVFDKQYYQNLLSKKGLLSSDQGLFSANEDVVASTTKALVQKYSDDGEQFFSDFGASMVKMGSIPLPAGSAGEIRCNCRVPNPK
ncbi:Peroxidase N [Hordeum vulgare]|nr:Peroxidase N [Hordeum vulgare]